MDKSSNGAQDRTVADVLRLIRGGEATTTAELARSTGLSRSALARCLDQLQGRRLVTVTLGPSSGGRPPRSYAFNASAGVVLAADLGASRGRLAVAHLDGHVLADRVLDVAIAEGPDVVLSAVVAGFDALLAEVGSDRDDIAALGIGLPGPVDAASGRPVRPPIMPGWDGTDVRGWFAARFDAAVAVDNDVNAMALGEYWRSPNPGDDLLFVKVGSGIGAGLVVDGAIRRGSRGSAGDIGHIRVDHRGSTYCECGNENCLEAIASGRAVAQRLALLGFDTTSADDVVALVDIGEREAIRAVRQAGRDLGSVLAAAVNLLNPATIVIGGDLAAAREPLLAGVREVVYQRSTSLATQSLSIETSTSGASAGIDGCVVLAVAELQSEHRLVDFSRRRLDRSA